MIRQRYGAELPRHGLVIEHETIRTCSIDERMSRIIHSVETML